MSNFDPRWKPLLWDTDFFDVKTARITIQRLTPESLSSIMTELSAWGAQVVHFLADADDGQTVWVAEQAGFHLVDIRLTFVCNLQKIDVAEYTGDIIMREHRDEDVPALQRIARSSYQQTRYYYDLHYPRERCDALYETWITKSCHDSSQKVIVAEHHGQVSGFITYQYGATEEMSTIGLVGVREDTRGFGIGRLLVQAVQRDLIQQKVPTLAVVTQGRNIDAQRLYQRCGFVTHQVGLWYHKWL